MKNSMRLYRSTLKMLLVPACIMGIISVVSSVLYICGRIKEINYYGFGMFFRGEPTAFAIAPSLIVLMFVGSIAFTYMAFSHLNKRNASDFYHSLPYTRMENYVSRLSAILTYQVLIIVLTLLASMLTLMATGTSFNLSFVPLLFFGYTAGSLLVIGATVLAMSITGTFLSNVLVTGLILFLPRMIMFIADQFIISVTLRRVLIGHTGILLNPVYNIATASLLDISRLWEYYGLSETLINVGSIIYTFTLGLIYVALATYLMKRRKSELSEKGAINSKAACAMSAVASLPFLILAVYITNGKNLTSLGYTSYMYLLIIIAIAFAVFIIVGFMLNARWKPILKSIPLFAVAVVVAIGIISCSIFIAKNMAMKLPSRDKIEYIRINEHDGIEYRFKPVYSYNSLLASETKFYEDDVIDAFLDTLKANNESWQEQINGDYNQNYSVQGRVVCEFKLKNGKSIYRHLNIYTKDMEKIYDICIENQSYVDAYTALPKEGELSTYYENISKETLEKVWRKYQDEYAAMSLNQKLLISSSDSYNSIFGYKLRRMSHPRSISTMRILGYVGNTPYSEGITIGEYTPVTATFYMREMNKLWENTYINDLENALKKDAETKSYINIQISDEKREFNNFMYSNDIPSEELEYIAEALTDEELKELIRIFKRQDLSDISIDKPYLIVNIDKIGLYEKQNNRYVVYIPLSKSDMEYIAEMYAIKIDEFDNSGDEMEIFESAQ